MGLLTLLLVLVAGLFAISLVDEPPNLRADSAVERSRESGAARAGPSRFELRGPEPER